ncbi:MAG: helix-turn-helix domain-containing protein [Haloferacaceae archaeon]
MTPTLDHPREVAVDRLRALGLSAYAARTYVALVALSEGTATDVSETVDVPRTRVSDAAEELRERGLVDVRQSTPRRFRPVSTETTGRRFQREYADHVEALTAALDEVERETRPVEQSGVWTVTGRDAVVDRAVEFVDAADEEVVYTAAESLSTDAVTAALRAASERGVDVRLAEMSPASTRRVREAVPDATPFESLWDWSDTPAGRLLLVDERRTLVSVLVNGSATDGPRDETAIWGSGPENGLVVVLRALFGWQG